jgi:hypothetical protein
MLERLGKQVFMAPANVRCCGHRLLSGCPGNAAYGTHERISTHGGPAGTDSLTQPELSKVPVRHWIEIVDQAMQA